MYLKKVNITNIRSIDNFKMEFEKPAGWHVLIGDNGAGKSTIIRSIALGLVGPEEALGLRANWKDWLKLGTEEGGIELEIQPDKEDKHTTKGGKLKNQYVPNKISFTTKDDKVLFSANTNSKTGLKPERLNWGQGSGWFSVAFGPYRRFAGGNPDWTKVFYSQPKLGAHLSAFGEDVALTEATEWLVKLQYQSLESMSNNAESNYAGALIEDFKKLINSEDFLPHKAELDSISSEGVRFKDGNGKFISVEQMSDGYRSILSLTFELIRHMVRVYSANLVFRHIRKGEMIIDLPGVVLVDEIDAHLHPTWQTRIGQWFTKYFPKIQFLVTTHSPLVCRAAINGSIWRLTSPGSDQKSGQVKGIEQDRLILGNVLDAYGTEIFGKNVSISQEGNNDLNLMAELNVKSLIGEITSKEEKELDRLKSIYPTENSLK